jgi:hypothetical protein
MRMNETRVIIDAVGLQFAWRHAEIYAVLDILVDEIIISIELKTDKAAAAASAHSHRAAAARTAFGAQVNTGQLHNVLQKKQDLPTRTSTRDALSVLDVLALEAVGAHDDIPRHVYRLCRYPNQSATRRKSFDASWTSQFSAFLYMCFPQAATSTRCGYRGQELARLREKVVMWHTIGTWAAPRLSILQESCAFASPTVVRATTSPRPRRTFGSRLAWKCSLAWCASSTTGIDGGVLQFGSASRANEHRSTLQDDATWNL